MGHDIPKVRELVEQCAICKKNLYRDEADKWVYHDSVGCVCKHHHGVEEWYNGLIEASKKDFEQFQKEQKQ